MHPDGGGYGSGHAVRRSAGRSEEAFVKLDAPASNGTGQCHVQGYMRVLLEGIPPPLDQAPHGYDLFELEADGCEKVVLQP